MSISYFEDILKMLFLKELLFENKIKILIDGLQVLTLDKIIKSLNLK